MTSLVDLGLPVSLPEVDMVLRREFEALFGATMDPPVRTEAGTRHEPRTKFPLA